MKFLSGFLIGVFLTLGVIALSYRLQNVKVEGHYIDSLTKKYHEYKCLEIN